MVLMLVDARAWEGGGPSALTDDRTRLVATEAVGAAGPTAVLTLAVGKKLPTKGMVVLLTQDRDVLHPEAGSENTRHPYLYFLPGNRPGFMPGALMPLAFIALVVAISLGLFSCVGSMMAFKEEREELRAGGCVLQSEKKTGKTKYCGKACHQKEIVRTYACASGEKIIVSYE